MAHVMIIDAERLHETPKAFQDYVHRYATEKTILGKRALVMCIKITGAFSSRDRGYAPGHSVDLMRYRDGLADGQSLNDWIYKATGTYLWTFAGGYDSDDVVHD
jgi:hypothetical protein